MACLSLPSADVRDSAGAVPLREAHMPLGNLAGDRVYKPKRPVGFPYLNAARKSRTELDRRGACGVDVEVKPLTASEQGLAIGITGTIVARHYAPPR